MNQSTPAPCDFQALYRQYIHGLLQNDRVLCRGIFLQWLEAQPSLRRVYEDLVQRSLHEIGALWQSGQISVAEEHLATAITESLLNLAYPRLFAQPRSGNCAVVASCAAEYHQLGAKLVADIFELNGWRGYFAGAGTPLNELLRLIREKQQDAVALSLTVYANLGSLVQTVAAVRAAFQKVPILVGGQAFLTGGLAQVEKMPGVTYLGSLTDLEAWIQSHGSHV